jgi:divalent metal cation (Fe/Co/Zn/Cd) transporter
MIERAVLLEKLTLLWTIVAGGAGLTLGVVTRSVALTAFGLDSAVEAICAFVLLRRLLREIHGSGFRDADERQAARLVGALLLFAAAYVTADAVWHLHLGREPSFSSVGIGLTILTLPIMIPLADQKLRIAAKIGSRALRADAIGNAVCWYLAAIVLVSLIARMLFPLWWFDGAASLLVVGVLLVEGVQAWRAGAPA